MLIFLVLGLAFLFLLALIYLLSFSPGNTICPKCQQKKPKKQHGWKMLCQKCEGGLDE